MTLSLNILKCDLYYSSNCRHIFINVPCIVTLKDCKISIFCEHCSVYITCSNVIQILIFLANFSCLFYHLMREVTHIFTIFIVFYSFCHSNSPSKILFLLPKELLITFFSVYLLSNNCLFLFD